MGALLQLHNIQKLADGELNSSVRLSPILRGKIVQVRRTSLSAFCIHCIVGRNNQDNQNLWETSLPINNRK